MKRMILFSGLLCTLVVAAVARDWGFSKDTVYESSVGWEDAVSLINQGPDTLKLDSVVAENNGSSVWDDISFIYQPSTVPIGDRYCSLSGGGQQSCELKAGGIAADSFLVFHDFRVGELCPTARASAETAGGGDSVEIRLRVVSSQMEEDTLLVLGSRCPTSSISPYRPPNLIKGEVPGRDILGRFSPPRNTPLVIVPSR